MNIRSHFNVSNRVPLWLLIATLMGAQAGAAQKTHAIYAGVDETTEFFCLIHWQQLIHSPLVQQMKGVFAGDAGEGADPFAKKDAHLGLSLLDIAAVSFSASNMASVDAFDPQTKDDVLATFAKSGIAIVVQTTKPVTAEQFTQFFIANASEEEQANMQTAEVDGGFIITTTIPESDVTMATGLVPFDTAALIVVAEDHKVRQMIDEKGGSMPAALQATAAALPTEKSFWLGFIPSDQWKRGMLPNSEDSASDETNPQKIMIQNLMDIGVGLLLTDMLRLGIHVGFSSQDAAELATSSVNVILEGLKAQSAEPNHVQGMFRDTLESIEVLREGTEVNVTAQISNEEISQVTQMLAMIAANAMRNAEVGATEPAAAPSATE